MASRLNVVLLLLLPQNVPAVVAKRESWLGIVFVGAMGQGLGLEEAGLVVVVLGFRLAPDYWTRELELQIWPTSLVCWNGLSTFHWGGGLDPVSIS